MAHACGYGGAVDGISTVRKWGVQSTAGLQEMAASNTKGGKARFEGNEDWSGSFDAYGHTPVRMPGDTFNFKGSIDGAKGVAGDAIVDQIALTIPVEAGGLISYVTSFSSAGELTLGASVAADTSAPARYSAKYGAIYLADSEGVTFVKVAKVRNITLTILTENAEHTDSSAPGVVGRDKGGVDWKLSYQVYTNDFSTLPEKGSIVCVRVAVAGTEQAGLEYWGLKYGRVGDLSNLEVDIEGKKPVGATVNIEFSGFEEGNTGEIAKPGGSVWWPFAS